MSNSRIIDRLQAVLLRVSALSGRWLLAIACVIPLAVICLVNSTAPAAELATNDYSAVDAIFARHCLECHEAKDPEANLVLENFESLMKGGENGPAISPGKSGQSLLIKMIE